MIKVGIIGFGFMGRTHFDAWQQVDNAQVCAICDKTLAEGKKELAPIEGNISTGYTHEIAHFARQITGDPTPDILTPEDSMQTIKVVLAEKESANIKEPININ